jgi:hypothetical protein
MIYRTFEQWKSGNVLEHGVPRTEHYSEDQLDLVEMGWNYGYDAGRAVEQALDKMAENARELGLDYEPVLKDNSNYRYDPPVAEPVAYLCENAVGHKYFRWKKPSSTFKPIALYTTPPASPVQDLPFGVGGGLVAIKTLLSRDPCVHANTAIEMIDAILKEHPAAPVQEGRDWSLLEATQESLREHMAEIKRLKAAQPAAPDAIGPNEDELPAYAAGWNDCRAEMLKGMKL